MQTQSKFVEQKNSISSSKVVSVVYWKKGMLKIWAVNTGTISPNSQKILSGVKCFSRFIFSFIEVASQAPLDRCDSINWSQRLVSMPCVEAAYEYLDGWKLHIFCGFVKGITVLPVLGVSWGSQGFFFLYPQSLGQHIHYKEQKDCTHSWGPAFPSDVKVVSIWLCWRREKSERSEVANVQNEQNYVNEKVFSVTLACN